MPLPLKLSALFFVYTDVTTYTERIDSPWMIPRFWLCTFPEQRQPSKKQTANTAAIATELLTAFLIVGRIPKKA